MHRRPTLLLVTVLLASSLALAACGDDASGGSAGPSTTQAPPSTGGPGGGGDGAAAEPVVRDVLSEQVDPPGAAGMTLSLVRYTIAPGAQLAPHVHPGIQMASIESGTLSYTVESGTATIRRASGDEEAVTGPASTTIGAGESVVEVGDMVHFGANDTDEPIVIVAALLTEDGAGLSVPVTAPAATSGTA